MRTIDCPCGSGKQIQDCCGKWIVGKKKVPTAEALMRSRYTAYVLEDVNYLVETTLPASRNKNTAQEISSWMKQVQWQRLHVLNVEAGEKSDSEGTVEFIAEFIGPDGTDRHHEVSQFEKVRGTWFYVG
jgi:SEC-C motif-containing protein